MTPKVSISIRVFPYEKEELVKLAKENDTSIDRLVRTMVRAGLKAKLTITSRMEAQTDIFTDKDLIDAGWMPAKPNGEALVT